MIDLMGKGARMNILTELADSRYYLLLVDSTPGLSGVDQMPICIRYCFKGNKCESFLGFFPITDHFEWNSYTSVSDLLRPLGVTIEDCRDQTYDNSPNILRNFEGVQAHIFMKIYLVFAYIAPDIRPI
jgi:hypothetical protein